MRKILGLVVVILIVANINADVANSNGGILFTYDDANASQVSIAGSLNEWNSEKDKLEKDANGIWSIKMKLSEGTHTYKFVVDGNWNFDQTNPDIEDDGYGGSNSVIHVDADRKLVKSSAVKANDGIKASFNPKIYFTGRYYTNNNFRKEITDRFMLDKPEHDINLGFKIKFNNDFEGFTMMNINNDHEGTEMWKSHLNYKRSYLKMKTEVFNLTAFDNLSLVRFDDPLNIVGNAGKYGYDFGYGYRGIYADKDNLLNIVINNDNVINLGVEVLYANKEQATDDIGSARFKLVSEDFFGHNFTLGSSVYKYTIKDGETIKTHDSNEFDLIYSYGFENPNWKDDMRYTFYSEIYNFENIDEAEEKNVWLKGDKFLFGSKFQFPAALSVYGQYLKTNIDFEFADNAVERNAVSFGSNFKLENAGWNLDFEYRTTELPDSLLDWGNYYRFVEATTGNGRWYDTYTNVDFDEYTILGYETGLLWSSVLYYQIPVLNRELSLKLINKFAHHAFGNTPKYIDNNFIAEYEITKKWKLLTDTRIPFYNDEFLELKTDFAEDQDVFVSNYTELSFYFSPKTRISIGYGVCPRIIDSVTDKFSYTGRDEFLNEAGGLEEYIGSFYGGFGERIRDAEEKLMDEQRITIQGVIEF